MDTTCILKLLDEETIFGDDWTDTAHLKLIDWKKEAERLAVCHDVAREMFKKKRDMLVLPMIFLSGATTVLLGANPTNYTNLYPITLVTLLVSGLNTFISGLHAYYDYGDRSINHLQSSNLYMSLARTIDYTLCLPPKKRPDVEVSFVQVTSSFDSIGANAPPIPMACRSKEAI